MKLSPAARTAYWFGLVVVLGWFLLLRVNDAVEGRTTAADAIVFAVWIALMLAPLFSEVELVGVKLKQLVDDAKSEIKAEIVTLRNEVTNSVDVRTNLSQQFQILTPVPDNKLPALEERIKRAVADAVGASSPPAPQALPQLSDVGPAPMFLFTVRHNLEKELRRIGKERDLISSGRRALPIHQLSRMLQELGLIEPQLEHAIREVYAVCSPAVHGESVSEVQLAFVKDVGPPLVEALRAIS